MDLLTVVWLVGMFAVGFTLWVLLFVAVVRVRDWWWAWTSPAPEPVVEPDPEPVVLVAVGAIVGDRVFVSVPPGVGPVCDMPGAVWRPDVLAWETTLDDLASVAWTLGEHGERLLLVRVPEQAATTSWAAAMFDALPVDLHEPVRRALVRVLHPDQGGDAGAFRAVTDARPARR